MELREELERVAARAQDFAEPGETVSGVLAAEPSPGERTYLCAFENGVRRSWLALDGEGRALESRAAVRSAVSIAALCELAEETSGGGDLEELRAKLVSLRMTESPPGIEEAEEAALALERVVGRTPRVATPAYLDGVGVATRRLEQALGGAGPSPFAEAMKLGIAAVDELSTDVESGYKLELR